RRTAAVPAHAGRDRHPPHARAIAARLTSRTRVAVIACPGLELATLRATIATCNVAVVALLTGIDDVVTTHSLKGKDPGAHRPCLRRRRDRPGECQPEDTMVRQTAADALPRRGSINRSKYAFTVTAGIHDRRIRRVDSEGVDIRVGESHVDRR